MADVLDEWAEWATEHLPAPARLHKAKAEQEWAEFLADPNVEEAVDVMMCLAAFVKAKGHSPSGWVREKHYINAERRWNVNPMAPTSTSSNETSRNNEGEHHGY